MESGDEDVVLGELPSEKEMNEVSAMRLIEDSRRLPPSQRRRFSTRVETGETEAEKLERHRAHAWKTMWTTPGYRPLAEPPVLDWDFIFNEQLSSDAQYAALFPNDPERTSRQKLLDGEDEALLEYLFWAETMWQDRETYGPRRRFYHDLMMELREDWQGVSDEGLLDYNEATDIGRFECAYFDRKGGTTDTEQFLARGIDVSAGYGEYVRDKYRHLIPPDLELRGFEREFLDADGTTATMELALNMGIDVLSNCHSDVHGKYGHLRYLLPKTFSEKERAEERLMLFLNRRRRSGVNHERIQHWDSARGESLIESRRRKFDLNRLDGIAPYFEARILA